MGTDMKPLKRESHKLRELWSLGYEIMMEKSKPLAGFFTLGYDYILHYQGVAVDRMDDCSSEFAILVFHMRVLDGRYTKQESEIHGNNG